MGGSGSTCENGLKSKDTEEVTLGLDNGYLPTVQKHFKVQYFNGNVSYLPVEYQL